MSEQQSVKITVSPNYVHVKLQAWQIQIIEKFAVFPISIALHNELKQILLIQIPGTSNFHFAKLRAQANSDH